MSLEHQFNSLLQHLLGEGYPFTINPKAIINCLDLTILDDAATPKQLDELNQLAINYEVAAVCVFPKHLPEEQKALPINWATVVNFPGGTLSETRCLEQIDQAKALNFSEIDYVLPYQSYLSGQRNDALKQCQTVIEYCKTLDLKSKIIIESGAFPNMISIYELSQALCDLGCDFIKTSTGKIQQGASLDSAFAITSAIKERGKDIGIKISGGVKTRQQALVYATLAETIIGKSINKSWFRIGASSLIKELCPAED